MNLAVDWQRLFELGTPLPEIFLRGTLTYLGIFLMVRVLMKRETGTVGLTDFLVVVLLADAAQNAMADDYRSLTDGVLLVMTILFWSWALDWLGTHVAWVQRLVHPPALPLIEDGRMLLRNMRKELITPDELLSQLRLNGVERVEDVKRASIEGDGRISVIPRDPSNTPLPEPSPRPIR